MPNDSFPGYDFATRLSQHIAQIGSSFSGHVIWRTTLFLPNVLTETFHTIPSDVTYDQVRQLIAKRLDNRYPLCVVYCSSTKDVSTILHSIRAVESTSVGSRPRVNIRSGGHSYEGLSTENDAIVIDVSALNSIDVDEDEGTAWVGAGTKTGVLYYHLAKTRVKNKKPGGQINGNNNGNCDNDNEYSTHYNNDDNYAHWDFPAGLCPSVGVAGIALGGGYGLLSRAHGLSSDHVLEMEIVDCNGAIRRVSASESPELYWALRGAGGGSFGVVTSLHLRLLPSLPKICLVRMTFPFEHADEVLACFEAWQAKADRRFTSQLNLAGTKPISLHAKFLGSVLEATRLMHASVLLTHVPAVDEVSFTACTSGQANLRLSVGPSETDMERLREVAEPVPIYRHQEGTRTKKKSAFLYRDSNPEGLTAAGRAAIIRRLQIDEKAVMQLEGYGGAFENRQPEHDGPYPHAGDVQLSLQYWTEWQDAAENGAHEQAMRDWDAELAPFIGTKKYRNYEDLDVPEDKRAETYFGGKEHWKRLLEVKRQFDPDDVFKCELSVPVRAQEE